MSDHRHTGRTDMNEFSSRSHTIFRVIVESRERLVEGKSEDEVDGGIRVTTLSLVDLAGSERVIDNVYVSRINNNIKCYIEGTFESICFGMFKPIEYVGEHCK